MGMFDERAGRLSKQDLVVQQQIISDKARELRNANKTLRAQQAATMREQMWKGIKWGFEGFNNIAKSLNNPNDPRRMKIAQMPAKRSDIDIVRHADIGGLKHPGLRNRDIRGRLSK